ncbi:urea-proton symporter DUR3-like [Acanthaster planci]|uniref:Urea-proton symporter DUR3-like n=1 Tax=Acanthaster planci TaxID=133434 RepID=A0A8B7XY66_ACAPL|nr:urea-proton symporter DUR3-like [Acanthaster planci]
MMTNMFGCGALILALTILQAGLCTSTTTSVTTDQITTVSGPTIPTECRELYDTAFAVANVTSQPDFSMSTLTLTQAFIMTAVFGIFCISMAHGFNWIRRHVYEDQDNLDTDFDAGGQVSMGLTATTVVSQWTWAATLLQSSAVATTTGISGPFWYAAGATIPLLLFATLSAQMKTRAPGAKTFLQVIMARFGPRTHLVFCFFALLTNIIVTAMLMLGGCAVLTTLVDGLSLELAAMTLAAVIGAYTFIGGLGATFYVSYFNTSVIFIILLIFLVKVYHDPADNPDNPLGSVERVFNLLLCSQGPEDNWEKSYLTFLSPPGIMFGIVNIVGNFGTVFVDQSYWQSSVAAKPRQGMWGFLIGGMVWFAIPFAFSTTMGLAYTALSTYRGKPLLTDDLVNQGLAAPAVANELMGSTGGTLMVLLILMAVTSTGSAEVIAITSIIVYDLYQIHLKPYRSSADINSCLLCGKSRGRMANKRDMCSCCTMGNCTSCTSDDRARKECKRALKPVYKCKTHGSYRSYLELLRVKRDWAILWVSIAIIPLTLLFDILQVTLSGVYSAMGVFIGSSVVPIILGTFWTRLTSKAMASGALVGMLLGITSWLVSASLLYKKFDLSAFMTNSGDNNFELSMLIGNCTSLLSGGLIAVGVTFFTKHPLSEQERMEIWEKTRDIDNPLSPWTELYVREFNITDVKLVYNRPSLEQMLKEFKRARYTTLILSLGLTVLMVLIWPIVMTALFVLNKNQFQHWINLTDTWAFTAAIFIIVVPLATEVKDIVRQFKHLRARVRVAPSISETPDSPVAEARA